MAILANKTRKSSVLGLIHLKDKMQHVQFCFGAENVNDIKLKLIMSTTCGSEMF